MTTASSGEPAVDAIDAFDPMRPEVLKHPYAAWQALRDRPCPVAALEPLSLWVVSRHAEARSVLTAPEAFSAARAFGKDSTLTDSRSLPARHIHLGFSGESGGVVSSSDGEVHVRLRRMIVKLLGRSRLDVADRAIRRHVHQVISGLAADRREFDVVGDLAKPVATRAIAGIMGIGEEVAQVLASWADLTTRALDPGDELSEAAAAPRIRQGNLRCVRAVATFLDAGVRSGPASGPGEFVEAWRQARTPAAREEVILSVLQFFQAGYETIVSAISCILAAFVVDRPAPPAAWLRPDLLADVIDEGVRLASPVRATVRTAVGDQSIGGVRVPDGAMTMILLGSANRDERVFSAPGEMRSGRRTPHLAFGAGPHRCIGRFLAGIELQHVLTALLSSAERISAAGEARVSANLLKAGYDYLPVRVEWRSRTLFGN